MYIARLRSFFQNLSSINFQALNKEELLSQIAQYLKATNSFEYRKENEIPEELKNNFPKEFVNEEIKYLFPIHHSIEIEDKTEEFSVLNRIQNRIQLGLQTKTKCEKILEFILGYHLEKNFSVEEILNFETQLKDFLSSLRSHNLKQAETLVDEIVISDLVTQEFLDDLKKILKENFLERRFF